MCYSLRVTNVSFIFVEMIKAPHFEAAAVDDAKRRFRAAAAVDYRRSEAKGLSSILLTPNGINRPFSKAISDFQQIFQDTGTYCVYIQTKNIFSRRNTQVELSHTHTHTHIQRVDLKPINRDIESDLMRHSK